LHLGLRRQEVLGSRADDPAARRARALRADQRLHDGTPDPSARPLERARQRARRVPALQAHHQRQAGRKAELPRHRRRARALGLSLPSALSHGDGHVPGGAGVMSALRIIPLAAALIALAAPAWAQTSATKAQLAPGMDSGAMPPIMDQGIYAHAIFNQLE